MVFFGFFVLFGDLRFVSDLEFFIDRNLLCLEFLDFVSDLEFFIGRNLLCLESVLDLEFLDLDFDQRVFLRLDLESDFSLGVLQSVLLSSLSMTTTF